MMRKVIEKFGCCLLIFIILIGCSSKQTGEYKIIGGISTEYDGNMIMLFTLWGDSIISVDTTIVQNGAFMFQGKEFKTGRKPR